MSPKSKEEKTMVEDIKPGKLGAHQWRGPHNNEDGPRCEWCGVGVADAAKPCDKHPSLAEKA